MIEEFYSYTHLVSADDLASALPGPQDNAFPPVLATSRMIAYMELAAAQLLIPSLQAGQLSVGVDVNIKHLAPTLEGREVTVSATFVGHSDSLFVFNVEVKEEGQVVGAGTHSRAIIDTERLLLGARNK